MEESHLICYSRMLLVVPKAVFIGTLGVPRYVFSSSTVINYLAESMAVRNNDNISKPPFLPSIAMWAMRFRRKSSKATSRNLPYEIAPKRPLSLFHPFHPFLHLVAWSTLLPLRTIKLRPHTEA